MRCPSSVSQTWQQPESIKLKLTPTELPPDDQLQLGQSSPVDLPSFKEGGIKNTNEIVLLTSPPLVFICKTPSPFPLIMGGG